jgi:RNA polymerase primary sigma factor
MKTRPLVITNKITDRSTSAFQKYLNDVQNRTVLSPHEEAQFAKRSREGDPVAKKILIETNLRFVISVAKQYANGVALEDLVNEGNMGLIKAVERYDETKGFKFISYAVHWIRRYIIEHINSTKAIRLPLNKVQDVSAINKKIVELEHKYQREITLLDLLDGDYKDDKEVQELLRIKSLDISSYNKKMGEGETEELIDMIAGDYSADALVVKTDKETIVANALKHLNEREVRIISLRFGLGDKLPMTLEEVGEMYNMTREGVRQIEKKALEKIREKIIG